MTQTPPTLFKFAAFWLMNSDDLHQATRARYYQLLVPALDVLGDRSLDELPAAELSVVLASTQQARALHALWRAALLAGVTTCPFPLAVGARS